MRKIQHGIAGFFTGVFVALLLVLVEGRIIGSKHPALLFIVNALTVFVCGIIGIAQGLRIERRKSKK